MPDWHEGWGPQKSLLLWDGALDVFPCVSAHLDVLPLLSWSQQLLKHLCHLLWEPNLVLLQEQAMVAQESPQCLGVPEEQARTLNGTPEPSQAGNSHHPPAP